MFYDMNRKQVYKNRKNVQQPYPNRLLHKLCFTIITLLLALISIQASAPPQKLKYNVLIITSFDPDTEQMGSFLSTIDKHNKSGKVKINISVASLFCRNIGDTKIWMRNLVQVLSSPQGTEAQAIVLVGQEAWATYLQLKEKPQKPVYVCYASKNGLKIPVFTEGTADSGWTSQSIDMEQYSNKQKNADFGGYINNYNLDKNIELIRRFYPNTQHVAFISDNTYGGVSLQAFVLKGMKKHKDLQLHLIDLRKIEVEEVPQKIKGLPPNTVLLVGTWRISRSYRFLLRSSMDKIIEERPSIPVFTLTGSGLGTIAIGGYIPNYENGAKRFLDQFFLNQQGQDFTFQHISCEYVFDREKISQFNIKEKLPQGCRLINELPVKIKKYEEYIITIVSILILALLLLALCAYLINRLRHTTKQLILREKDLLQAKEKAEIANKTKSAFLANMSHEIRTPLNAIVGYSSLLAEESINMEEKREFMKIIDTNTQLLLRLIDDVLYVSRFEAGRIQLNYIPTDINELCKQAFNTAFNKQKQEVNYHFIPSEDTFTLYTDPPKLLQILINLMSNAQKFTDKGSIQLTYTIREEQNEILFSVTDTGCGIPQEKKKEVFDRFEKLDEFKQGTGLGLSICRMNVQLFGGKIWVDPEYVEGAKFLFTHPLIKTEHK